MRAAIATEPSLAEPMLAALKKGNAADAIVCGLLAAAAIDESVLLGPAQILIGGTGAGMRAIDGRCRQPGLGSKRPRGYLEGDKIPDVARIAVPGLPAAAMVLHVSFASAPISTIASILKPIAKGASEARARILERVMGGGAGALSKVRELLAVTLPTEGGLLSAEDLEDVRPDQVACEVERVGKIVVGRVPWEVVDRPVELLAASDTRGLVAVACYESPKKGVPIPGTDLVAPLFAEPVKRGIPRVRPGEPLPAPCPLALLGAHKSGSADQAIAAKKQRILSTAIAAIGEGELPTKEVLFVATGKRP